MKLLAAMLLAISASVACAHPVPKDSHDRTIVVRLQKGAKPDQVRVRIEYRVEVDETTVFLNDMKPFRDEVDPLAYRGRALEYYAEFTKIYAPIYADRLILRVNKTKLDAPKCLSRKERLQDEDGTNLGHLRCDFVFETTFTIDPDAKTTFSFREQNYYLEAGTIILSVVNETDFAIENKTCPDEAFRKTAEPSDERLREGSLVLVRGARLERAEAPATERHDPIVPHEPSAEPHDRIVPHERAPETLDERFSLLRLILHSDYGFWVTILLAFVFGAAHALTPGHGKTLVAAYLVGERGTVWHALYLGLVTTLTHTGVVLVLAVIVALLPDEWQADFTTVIMRGLGLVMGLIVVAMGFWLLLQRLAGRADHVHLDGPKPEEPSARSLTWWGLTLLGVAGGIVPCWDAVGLLCMTVGSSQLWIVLPSVIAFSAGLAVVLVAIGVLIVHVPKFAQSKLGAGRIVQAVPVISAILVTLMGIWLCYEAVHG
jgi:ABC-type nickel/cobalt efflux system permease component RcnA